MRVPSWLCKASKVVPVVLGTAITIAAALQAANIVEILGVAEYIVLTVTAAISTAFSIVCSCTHEG